MNRRRETQEPLPQVQSADEAQATGNRPGEVEAAKLAIAQAEERGTKFAEALRQLKERGVISATPEAARQKVDQMEQQSGQ